MKKRRARRLTVNDAKRIARKQALTVLDRSKADYQSAEQGVRSRLRTTIACTYVAASILKNDMAARDEFFASDFFKDRTRKLKRDDVLRMSFCYVLGSLKGSRYHRGCTYAKALKSFFDDDEPVEKVVVALKEFGVEELFNMAVNPPAIEYRTKASASDNDDLEIEDKEIDEAPASPFRVNHGSGVTSAPVAAGPVAEDEKNNANDEEAPDSTPKKTREKDAKYPHRLVIDCSEEIMSEAMSLSNNERAELVIERMPSDLERKWIIAVAIKRKN